MGELLMRRRKMVLAGEVNHLLYSLENYTTNGSRIATGVYPLTPDFSLTILFDFNMTTNPTSGMSRIWKLIYLYNNAIPANGIVIGKRSATNTQMSAYWMSGTQNGMAGSVTSAGRHRIAITHEAGSDTLNISYKSGSGTRINYTLTKPFVASPENQLKFGGGADKSEQSVPPGTLTAKVYDIVLTAEEINAFFA